MKRGAILTQEQAELLGGRACCPGVYWIFDQDVNGNFVATEDQIGFSNREKHAWVKDLEIVDYEPKIFD